MPDFISKTGDPGSYHDAVNRIVGYLKTGHCIPFLGAGASIPDLKPSATNKPETEEVSSGQPIPDNGQRSAPLSDQTVPSGTGMAGELALKLGIDPLIQMDLPMAAFLFERVHDRQTLTTYIGDRLTGQPPSEAHRVLAKIIIYLHSHRSLEMRPVELIITTNFDQQLENELVYLNRKLPLRPPIKINTIIASTRSQQAKQIEEDSVNLLKLHGCVSDSDSLIVTDDDYIKMLNRLGGSVPTTFIDVTILGEIPKAGLLFLGYSLGDWDFRAFYEALMGNRSPSKKYTSYAVQRRPANPKEARKWDVTARYWLEKGIRVIDSLASDFLWDVYTQLNPQTGDREIEIKSGD